jgi:hypothetical protein
MDRDAVTAMDSMRTFLVERYWPGIDEPGVRAVLPDLDRAARLLTSEGTPVEHLGSILMPVDQVVFSLMSAANEAAVRAVNERAGLPLDRVAVAVALGLVQPGKGER